MKYILRLLWWGAYIIGALIVQQSIPGVDALMPGFLLALQEKNFRQSAWLFLLFVLIQEGSGNITFGGAILWYMGQVFFFRRCQRLLSSDNILFVFMLALILGAYHGALRWFMCAVQNVPVDYTNLVRESMIQVIIIPVIWGLAHFIRPKSALGIAKP